jgi:hypothetical protein
MIGDCRGLSLESRGEAKSNLALVTNDLWSVQAGEMGDPNKVGVPAVPTTVYEGDEAGARSSYADLTAEAAEQDYRYVYLRHAGDIIECWGTPPAVG